MDRNETIGRALDRLFRTYRQSDRGDPLVVAEERMERAIVYLDALAPYDLRDIEEAVRNFISGAAPGHNQAFPPAAPQVAAEVRRVMNLRLDSEARERLANPRLPPPDIVVTPEARARVQALVKQTVANLASLTAPEDKERERLRQESWQRTNDYFAPDSDEAETLRRLGYSVGDPDGDRDVA